MESRRGQGMKRWPLRILLCLTLGAITTVAVAWALGSLIYPGFEETVEAKTSVSVDEIGRVTESWRAARMESFGVTGFRSTRLRVAAVNHSETPDREHPSLVLPPWTGFDKPALEFQSRGYIPAAPPGLRAREGSPAEGRPVHFHSNDSRCWRRWRAVGNARPIKSRRRPRISPLISGGCAGYALAPPTASYSRRMRKTTSSR